MADLKPIAGAVTARVADDPPMPLVEHLAELRRRLAWMLGILLVGSAVPYYFSERLMERLAAPVGALVFNEPMEAFDTRFKVAFVAGFALTLPLLLHQVWLFVARAISRPARRMILVLLPASYLLFLAGAALCFFAVVPSATRFFLAFGASNVRPLITVSAYLDFVLRMLLSFGTAFQLPLVMFGLNRMGMVSRRGLAQWRRPFYFLSFVAGAFFTSPEVFTQFCLAIPLIILFEISLLIMRDPQ